MPNVTGVVLIAVMYGKLQKKVAKFRLMIVSARSSRTHHDVREPVARDFASMSWTCAQLSSRKCTPLGSRKCTRPVSRTCTRLAKRAPVKYTRELLQRAASSRLSLCDLHHVSLLAVYHQHHSNRYHNRALKVNNILYYQPSSRQMMLWVPRRLRYQHIPRTDAFAVITSRGKNINYNLLPRLYFT